MSESLGTHSRWGDDLSGCHVPNPSRRILLVQVQQSLLADHSEACVVRRLRSSRSSVRSESISASDRRSTTRDVWSCEPISRFGVVLSCIVGESGPFGDSSVFGDWRSGARSALGSRDGGDVEVRERGRGWFNHLATGAFSSNLLWFRRRRWPGSVGLRLRARLYRSASACRCAVRATVSSIAKQMIRPMMPNRNPSTAPKTRDLPLLSIIIAPMTAQTIDVKRTPTMMMTRVNSMASPLLNCGRS